MASNQFQLNMKVTADTAQARRELQNLRNELNNITSSKTNSSILGSNFTKEVSSAINDVDKLKVALKTATNDTGKLDVSKFSRSLSSMGLNAEKLKQSFSALGPAGNAAFMNLTKSVLNAEVPLKRTNGLITKAKDMLMKTASWQISGNVFRGLTGSIQKAFDYATKLDKSLTDIQIVTGQSTAQMATFAKQANNAAKALGTTTNAYAQASLLLYQQGLRGKDVTERADIIMKMSNVTGDAAKDVSSYMTAIWNNFADGSQTLESFADKLTALGAATASSTSEIAAGLEKFAAIADTVGLSYDYAASSLATVVAQTRQSADVVGTAFKTLFSRIQDLELGKQLDDGTTLGKYSQALASIGVNIKDVSGQVKDMNQILDEMGDKWGTISKDTQIAVAQAVAGKVKILCSL